MADIIGRIARKHIRQGDQRRRREEAESPSEISTVPFPEYADRPLDYFREVLGIEPWAAPRSRHGQIDIIEALPFHKSTSVRSGHKTGKSLSAGGLAWWWYSTRELARAVMTAPTSRQVVKVLWRELARLRRASKRSLDGVMHKTPSTGVQADDGREIIGFTADDPEAFSGISGPNVLYLVDEASGVSEEIFEAIEGNRAGGAYAMYFSNPTRPSGTFFESHHAARKFFHCIHIDSQDAALYGRDIPGLATSEWCEEKTEQWGEESSIFQVRVRGNFPPEGSNTVISLLLVSEATERWSDTLAVGRLVIGVDPAREGDDASVLQPVRGNKALDKKVFRGLDGFQLAAEVAKMAADLRAPDEYDPVPANVDEIGIGASVVDALAYNHSEVVTVCPVNSSRTADDEDQYFNLRAELHFGLRDWLRDGGSFESDPILESELVAATYKYDNRGRLQVEKKEDMKKVLKRSPNHADALQLAVYRGFDVPVITVPTGNSQHSRWQTSTGRGFG